MAETTGRANCPCCNSQNCERHRMATSTIESWVTPKAVAECLERTRERALAAEAEAEKWRNAHKSRVKCPEGHSAKDSRGECPWCDAEKILAERDVARAFRRAADSECASTMADMVRLRAENNRLKAELADLEPLLLAREEELEALKTELGLDIPEPKKFA